MKKFTIQLQNENFATNKVIIPLSKIKHKIKVVDAFLELPIALGSGTYSVNFSTEPSSVEWSNVDTIHVEAGKVIKVNISDELQDSLNAFVNSIILTFNGNNNISFVDNGCVKVEYISLTEYRKNCGSHTIDLKKAGKLSVDLTTKGTRLVAPIAASDNNPLPLEITANYNSDSSELKGVAKPLGKKWNLNICQYLKQNNIEPKSELSIENSENKQPIEELSFTYIDENGKEQLIEEKYYYLDNKNKVYVNRSDISVDVDGTLKYNSDTVKNKTVEKELESVSGLKLVSSISDIDEAGLMDNEPEEYTKVKNAVENLKNSIEEITDTISKNEQQICLLALTKLVLNKELENNKDSINYNEEYLGLLELIEKIRAKYFKYYRVYKEDGVTIDRFNFFTKEKLIQINNGFDCNTDPMLDLPLMKAAAVCAKNVNNEASSIYTLGLNYDGSSGTLKMQQLSNSLQKEIYSKEIEKSLLIEIISGELQKYESKIDFNIDDIVDRFFNYLSKQSEENPTMTLSMKDLISLSIQINSYLEQNKKYSKKKTEYENQLNKYEYQQKLYETQIPVHYLYNEDKTIMGFGKSNKEGVFRLVLLTDPYENTIYFNYESLESNSLQSITDSTGNTVLFEYEGDLLKSISDAKDRKTLFEYSNNCLARIINPDKSSSKYFYDNDKLFAILDESGTGAVITENEDQKIVQSVDIVRVIEDGKICYRDDKSFEQFNPVNKAEFAQYLNNNEKITIFNKNYKSTTVTDAKGKSITYLFDKLGNVRTAYENNFDKTGENVFVNITSFNYQNDIASEKISPLPYSINYLKDSCFNNPSIKQISSLYLGENEICGEQTLTSSFNACQKTHTIETNADLGQQRDCIVMSGEMLKHINLSYKNCNHKTYMVCGWAKADSAFVLTDENENDFADYIQNRKFELRVETTYHDNTVVSFKQAFDWRNTEWQYCAVPVRIDSTKVVDDIKCYIDYSGNTGKLEYTDLEFKEADWECVKYDDLKRPIRKEAAHSEWITLYEYDDDTTNVAREILFKTKEENDPERKEFITTYEYNKQGSLLRSTDYNGIIKENIYNDKGFVIKSVTYHKDEPSSKLYEEKVLDEKGKPTGQVNELGEKTNTYEYINGSGDISAQIDENGVKTAFGYATDGTLLETTTAINGLENTNTYGYTLDYITSLKHNDFAIKYDYDNLGRPTKTKIADKEYLKKVYGESEETTIFKTKEAYRQTFNDEGKLLDTYYIKKFIEGIEEQEEMLIARNIYDSFGNLVCTKEFLYSIKEDGSQVVKELSHKIGLDKFGNAYKEESEQHNSAVLIVNEYDKEHSKVENTVINIGENELFYNYLYSDGPDAQLKSIGLPNDVQQSIEYDKLGRVAKIENGNLAKTFSYLKKGDHTSNLISNTKFAVNGISNENLHYLYDKKGNITEIRNNNSLVARYQYDGLSRIIREDNKIFGKTTIFSYDAGGNMSEKIEYDFTLVENLDCIIGTSIPYSYPISGWKDQLMSYNGEMFEYDALGNPTTYRNKTLKWSHGRQLDKFADIAEFTYNVNGVRTSKKSNGFTTRYYLNGNQILMQKDASNELTFFYGADGVTGFHLKNNVIDEDFYYKKNVQNDVIGIYSTQGTQIARYSYDAWGNQFVEYLANNGKYVAIEDDFMYNDTSVENRFIAFKNPFRYRSYYYDFETNLYYLNSRYYDPEIGRFINADDISTLNTTKIAQNGLNLYAYCLNNPANSIDENGDIPKWLKWLLGGLILLVAVITIAATGGAATGFWSAVAVGAAKGALIGAGIGFASGLITGAITNDWSGLADSFMWGTIGGMLSGGISAGFKYAAVNGIKLVGDIVGKVSTLGNKIGIAIQTLISVGLYVGQTLTSGNKLSVAGFAFAILGGVAGGTLLSNHSSLIINIVNGLQEITRSVRKKFLPSKYLDWLM